MRDDRYLNPFENPQRARDVDTHIRGNHVVVNDSCEIALQRIPSLKAALSGEAQC
jgi:hypothetical protein